MGRPKAALVATDEKSQIQALQRAQPILPMDVGQRERRTPDCTRHGTLDLFAALNVATGEVLARCKRRHRATDLVDFLRDLDAEVEPDLDIHNYVGPWVFRLATQQVRGDGQFTSWSNVRTNFSAT